MRSDVTELIGENPGRATPQDAAPEKGARPPGARRSARTAGWSVTLGLSRSRRAGLAWSWRGAFLATLPAWVAAHLLIIEIQNLALRATPHFPPSLPGGGPIDHPLDLLYSWDTAWYMGLAGQGYHGMPSDGIRFSPLLPLVTRAVSALGVPGFVAILAVCWAAALVFGALMYRLALTETGDVGAARRAAWLSQLAPGAFVLVMGYTEALAGMCAAAFLLAVRQGARRTAAAGGAAGRTSGGGAAGAWTWHAIGFVTGLCSGLVRPTGLLLALPGAIELLRARRDPWPHLAARIATALSPLLGLGLFLGWSHTVYGSYMLPYTMQQNVNLRGTVAANPLTAIEGTLSQGGNGAGAYTLVLVAVSVALLWTCARRLPVSFTAWAAVNLIAAATAPHFSSYARYISADLPLLLAAALLAGRRQHWAWTIGSSAALCAFFAYQAFVGLYVP
jgi:hypothetical protein